MRFYLGRVRVPTVLVRHLPRRWFTYSFSAAEAAQIQKRADERYEGLRGLID